MPRLNASGDVALYNREWFDVSRTVYQDCLFPAPTPCHVVLSDGTDCAKEAASSVYGSEHGLWAARSSVSLEAGVFDALGRRFPSAGVGGCSPDNAISLKDATNSYGPWHGVEVDGTRWLITEGDAHSVQLLGRRVAVYMIGNRIYATDAMMPPNDPAYSVRACDGGGARWYLYQSSVRGELVVNHRVVAPAAATYFYPDVRWIDNALRIVWATTQADADVVSLTLTREQWAACPELEAPEPEPPIPPEPPEPTPIPPEPPDPQPPIPPKPEPVPPLRRHRRV